ncbi:hypothetical protein [Sagittula stellata]|uniref:Uncharacterized protein n=1 Tax=Sagittula stellata (strain ATCC 700073 / DSM 11524 / E-37) TaxID=388399 RepID=A3K1M4_SAGS3|nr:hypothetical protein [Sagittula stellata]EBA08820.1 hypothetical protein SSE37_04220 [Sagittula stellata E-37]
MRIVMEWLQAAAERMTCHHAMYGVMAAAYAGAEAHLWDKGALGLVFMAAYSVLALRP